MFNKEDKIIFFLTEIISKDSNFNEEMIENFDFNNINDILLSISLIERAILINRSKNILFAEIINLFIKKLNLNQQNLYLEALKISFTEKINFYFQNFSYLGLFYGKLIYYNLISLENVLNLYTNYIFNDKIFSSFPIYFIFLTFIIISDKLYKLNNEKYNNIIKILTQKGFKEFENFLNTNFQICNYFSDLNLPSKIDYFCFIKDDINYLRELSEDPEFDPNKLFNTPIWETDLIMNFNPTLIQASAFYGSEKCYHFLNSFNNEKESKTIHRPRNFIMRGGGRGGIMYNYNFRNIYKNEENNNKDLQIWNKTSFNSNSWNLYFNLFSLRSYEIIDLFSYSIAGGYYSIIKKIEPQTLVPENIYTCIIYNRIHIFNSLKEKLNLNKNIKDILDSIYINDNSTFFNYLFLNNIILIEDLIIPKFLDNIYFGYYTSISLLEKFSNQSLFGIRLFNLTIPTAKPFSLAEKYQRKYTKSSFLELIYVLITKSFEDYLLISEKKDFNNLFQLNLPKETIKLFKNSLFNTNIEIIQHLYSNNDFLKSKLSFKACPFLKSIIYDKFQLIEIFLKYPHIVQHFLPANLLKYCKSIEMRELIKKII